MDKAALLERISDPLGKKDVVSIAEKSSGLIPELIGFSLLKDTEAAFRAAWILELVVELSKEEFRNHVKDFIAAYQIQKNRSCQRHYTKIMMSLTDKRHDQSMLQGIDLEGIMEVSFEWLIDPETPVAVQCNCMDILYNLREQYEWIREELPHQVGFLLKNGSAALQSRGKRVLAKLASRRSH